MTIKDNENIVLDSTENVEEQATERLVDGASVDANEVVENTDTTDKKTYTEADIDKLVNEKLDKILPSKIERAKTKISREYEDKYEKLNRVLKAGLQTDSIEDATNQLEAFYKNNGVDIPERSLSESDMNYLAEKHANEVIDEGYDEVVKEVDRLANLGDNMNQQQKLMFMRLAEERKKQEDLKELAKIGVSKTDLDNSEYQQFASKLNPNMSAKEKYEMYRQFKPKPKYEQIGSMKNTSAKTEYKEYYTPEEARRLTPKDYDDPRIMEAVEKSMMRW